MAAGQFFDRLVQRIDSHPDRARTAVASTASRRRGSLRDDLETRRRGACGGRKSGGSTHRDEHRRRDSAPCEEHAQRHAKLGGAPLARTPTGGAAAAKKAADEAKKNRDAKQSRTQVITEEQFEERCESKPATSGCGQARVADDREAGADAAMEEAAGVRAG